LKGVVEKREERDFTDPDMTCLLQAGKKKWVRHLWLFGN
jgi:hypothetical protein